MQTRTLPPRRMPPLAMLLLLMTRQPLAMNRRQRRIKPPTVRSRPLEQSKVGEVDVVRPVISATTLEAAQSMTPQGAAASLPDSENISSDLPGGLTALASISSVNDPTVSSSKPRLPLAQRPYYRVLIKGEQLKPKAGRADDFTWPRS